MEKQKKQTLATGINIVKTSLKKYFYIMYYNYNKKDHYLKSCHKSLKN